MFDIFNKKKQNKFKSIDIKRLKEITKVLIIDDEEPTDLKNHLKKEGWNVSYLDDLDGLSNKKLVEAQIICIDIMGVGIKLGEENGMGLIKHIKDKYPEKKIILYSSVSKQDIFDESIDYVDKRLRKEASLLPFSSAIEELAESTYSWEDTIRFAYEKIRPIIGEDVTFEKFKIAAEKSVRGDKLDASKLGKFLGIGFDVSSKVASLVSLALQN